MTFTPCDLAFAAIAAPEPESRFTSSSTFAPFVIACSACCCWVALSPSAFWISTSTPAASNAAWSDGRSTVSQRTEDFESGSSTATLPASPPPLSLDSLLAPLPPLLSSSSPHAATTKPIANTSAMSQTAPFFMSVPLREWVVGSLREDRVRRPPRRPPVRAPP